MSGEQSALSAAEVRAIARLSRLQLSEPQIEKYRGQLSAVLGYVHQLRKLDVTGVEPLTRPVESFNRLGADTPGETIATERLMEMAPATMPPFIRVPRVFGEGGGA